MSKRERPIDPTVQSYTELLDGIDFKEIFGVRIPLNILELDLKELDPQRRPRFSRIMDSFGYDSTRVERIKRGEILYEGDTGTVSGNPCKESLGRVFIQEGSFQDDEDFVMMQLTLYPWQKGLRPTRVTIAGVYSVRDSRTSQRVEKKPHFWSRWREVNQTSAQALQSSAGV